MNKYTLEFLVTTSANIYFWLFIIIFIIKILYMQSTEYKELKEIKKKLGLMSLGIPPIAYFMWFLFILSIYYR